MAIPKPAWVIVGRVFQPAQVLLKACLVIQSPEPANAGDCIKPGVKARAETPGRAIKVCGACETGESIRAVARFTGLHFITHPFLGLTPQALCCRLLRRLIKQLVFRKTIAPSLKPNL
jgi:hypothetical protein